MFRKNKDKTVTIVFDGRHYILKAGDTFDMSVDMVIDGTLPGVAKLAGTQTVTTSIRIMEIS